MSQKVVNILCEDKEMVQISVEAALNSEYLSDAMEKQKAKRSADKAIKAEVDFSYMKRATVDYVRDYLETYKTGMPPEIKKPFPSGELDYKKLLAIHKKDGEDDNFRYEFISKLAFKDVADLSMAALRFGIPSLFDLCCSKLAELTKDKKDDEIFRVFNMTDTFTKEDKEDIREKNKWVEENILWEDVEKINERYKQSKAKKKGGLEAEI